MISIYADNAATTALDETAIEMMKPYLQNIYGNASQAYSFSREPKKALKEARATIAECIGCSPDEIYFTSGGTESDNWAIKGSAFADIEKRATITSQIEHHAILNSCKAIERLGYPVAYLYPTADGTVLPEELEKIITDQTRLVSVMFANNEIGTTQPLSALAKVAHSHGALFHTDAVQAVGHIPINVYDLGVDMLSASAHKFNGPKGVGFLYIKNGTKIAPLINGGAQEAGIRAGTENVASIVGMAVALRENHEHIQENIAHKKTLEKALLTGLDSSSISYVLNGGNDKLPGLCSLSFKDKDGEAILHRMDLMGISISTGSACDSVNTEISHVLKAIRLDENLAKGTIRISLGKNNTLDDVDTIVQSLRKILSPI